MKIFILNSQSIETNISESYFLMETIFIQILS